MGILLYELRGGRTLHLEGKKLEGCGCMLQPEEIRRVWWSHWSERKNRVFHASDLVDANSMHGKDDPCLITLLTLPSPLSRHLTMEHPSPFSFDLTSLFLSHKTSPDQFSIRLRKASFSDL